MLTCRMPGSTRSIAAGLSGTIETPWIRDSGGFACRPPSRTTCPSQNGTPCWWPACSWRVRRSARRLLFPCPPAMKDYQSQFPVGITTIGHLSDCHTSAKERYPFPLGSNCAKSFFLFSFASSVRSYGSFSLMADQSIFGILNNWATTLSLLFF